MFVHITRLLKLFFCLGSPIYEEACLAQLLILSHLRRYNHPVWQMFQHNLSAFNEECGELSFSVLSRSTQGDSLRSDIEHMNDTYRLIHLYRSVADDFESSLYRNQTVDGKHFQIAADSSEVRSLVIMFKEMIGSIQRGSYKPYRQILKVKGIAYKKKAEEEGLREDMKKCSRLFVTDIQSKLQGRIQAMTKKYQSSFYNDYLKNMFTSNLEPPPSVSDSFDHKSCSDSDDSDPDDIVCESIEDSASQIPISSSVRQSLAGVNASLPGRLPKSNQTSKSKSPKPATTKKRKSSTSNSSGSDTTVRTSCPEKRRKLSPLKVKDSYRPSGLRDRPRLNYEDLRRNDKNEIIEANDEILLRDDLIN